MYRSQCDLLRETVFRDLNLNAMFCVLHAYKSIYVVGDGLDNNTIIHTYIIFHHARLAAHEQRKFAIFGRIVSRPPGDDGDDTIIPGRAAGLVRNVHWLNNNYPDGAVNITVGKGAWIVLYYIVLYYIGYRQIVISAIDNRPLFSNIRVKFKFFNSYIMQGLS